MARSWTFGKKIGAGFAMAFAMLLIVGIASYYCIESLTQTSRWVAHTHEVLENLEDLLSLMKDAETGQRGYVITGDLDYRKPYDDAVPAVAESLKTIRALIDDNDEQKKRLDRAKPLIDKKLDELKRTIEMRKTETFEAVEKAIRGTEGKANEGKKYMDDLRDVITEMKGGEHKLLEGRAKDAAWAASFAQWTIIGATLICLVLVSLVGAVLTMSLTRQIGGAVQHIQSSSTELQAAANQQASGSKEQSTSMSEISTTISELLATSRQIAESAQRVAHIAEETAAAARAGDLTVQKSQESAGAIKRQVDLIVGHMLDLGKKSQQIGSILEIINELAEQTNILAINATIEAAGAGENGKRFSVVADEIRKLADRVASSTKEIRGLIDEIRSAVNTTVMATESGSKTVDAGARQFTEVAASFKHIANLVTTTTEASREIELSTKQQTTAVEQVTVAVSNVSQATKETESSSQQMLLTATQLAALSRDLNVLIQSADR